MTAPVFVDANLLVYADDLRDAAKHLRARQWLDALWASRRGRLSTQVLNEYYVVVTRKLKGLSQGDARAKVRRFQGWNPWQIDHATVETAWGIEARHGLHYWDCLVLAAAQHAGCAVLLSEDMQHEAHYGVVQVLNPFLVDPDSLLTAEP